MKPGDVVYVCSQGELFGERLTLLESKVINGVKYWVARASRPWPGRSAWASDICIGIIAEIHLAPC